MGEPDGEVEDGKFGISKPEGATGGAGTGSRGCSSDDPALKLRKYLLLLAILVATVTYVAGMDPPGGVWLETKDGHRTGNPILPATRRVRYTLFYYFNATAFAASLVVIILLLFMKHDERGAARLPAVRVVMVLDVLCLMVAYVAGSCRGYLTTVYASVLCAVVFSFVAVFTWATKSGEGASTKSNSKSETPSGKGGKLDAKERRKVLMLLAVFVTTITYTAALNPPGGFWEHAAEEEVGHHRAGDPILLERHPKRFLAFLISNTTAFAASLVVITLLLSRRLWNPEYSWKRLAGLYAGIAVALLGLMVAYAAGSSREKATTLYILCLVLAVVVYICALGVIEIAARKNITQCAWFTSSRDDDAAKSGDGQEGKKGNRNGAEDAVEKARSLILLLATLAATVTYQAGLNPPGGVWRDDGDGHNGGNLILLATHARRYKVFLYCNSAAFVASIVVVIMVQSPHRLVRPRALQAAVILDLFGLMGAYASGSCRDVLTSIYVFALAGIVFVGVVIHVVVDALNRSRKLSSSSSSHPVGTVVAAAVPGQDMDTERENEKKRKMLLLLAILAVSITYQAGLTPPGKFWLEHGDAVHHVGDPVLADNYPRRYKAFFYCNATSFMVSVSVIVVLVGRKLPDGNKKYWWWLLYASMGAGLIGLIGAYAAGTTRRVKTSAYVFALVGAVLLFAGLHIGAIHHNLGCWISSFVREVRNKLHDRFPNMFSPSPEASSSTGGTTTTPAKQEECKPDDDDENRKQRYRMSKYLLLLGILAASVTYQAGLDPPGSVWPTDSEGHAAGDPVLRDVSRRRYHAFFYSNSTCFVTSIVVIVLLLQATLLSSGGPWPMRAMHAAVVLDLLGLLVAYATGGSRDWGTSGYVLAMAATVLAYVGIYMVLSYGNRESVPEKQDGTKPVHDATSHNGSHNGSASPVASSSPQGDEEQCNGY